MTVEYLDLSDYVAIAAEVTGLDAVTVMRVASLDLADSALHAPAAGFGNTEFYPDFVDKAAVLIVRLAKNHPLPDGNKRASWVSLRLFIEINGWSWAERHQPTRPSASCSRSRPGTGARVAWLTGSARSWCTSPRHRTQGEDPVAWYGSGTSSSSPCDTTSAHARVWWRTERPPRRLGHGASA